LYWQAILLAKKAYGTSYGRQRINIIIIIILSVVNNDRILKLILTDDIDHYKEIQVNLILL